MKRKGLTDLINETRDRKEKAPVIGKVTAVYEKEDNEPATGNIEVNVQTKSADHEFRRVPVLGTEHSGHISVPQPGDYVIVEFTLGQGHTPIVTGCSFTQEDRAPNARAGHWRHEWGEEGDKLYLEAEPADGGGGDPEVVRMGIKPDGIEDPTTEIAVDNSGDDTKIKLNTDGEIHLNGDITVKVNDEKVVTESGSMNDTFLGLGGDVDDTGAT